MEETDYPLPMKLIERNSLTRAMNFDNAIDGHHFIVTNVRDDMIEKKHHITAFQQDVREDRTNWLKWSSKALNIREKIPRTFAVPLGFYVMFGTGSLSKNLPYAWILPEHPQRLPMGIKSNKVLFQAFSSMIKEIKVDATVVTNLEETISRVSEHVAKAEPDVARQRSNKEMMETAAMISSLKMGERPLPQDQKKKQDDH